MILALLIYLGADIGVIVAQPIIINALALGSIITTYWQTYQCGGLKHSTKVLQQPERVLELIGCWRNYIHVHRDCSLPIDNLSRDCLYVTYLLYWEPYALWCAALGVSGGGECGSDESRVLELQGLECQGVIALASWSFGKLIELTIGNSQFRNF